MLILSCCSLCPTHLFLMFTAAAAHCYCSLPQLLSNAATQMLHAQLLLLAAAHRYCSAAAPCSCSPLLFSCCSLQLLTVTALYRSCSPVLLFSCCSLSCCSSAFSCSAAHFTYCAWRSLKHAHSYSRGRLGTLTSTASCRSESSNISLVVYIVSPLV
jgi:hypothetical protein